MLVAFEGDMPKPCVISQFVETDEEFLNRVEEFVDIHKSRIDGVVRIEDEDGKLQELLDKLSEKYEVPLSAV